MTRFARRLNVGALDADLAATLGAVGSAMAGARKAWWIIGNTAVALHGAFAGTMADVDVLLDVEDARTLLPAPALIP